MFLKLTHVLIYLFDIWEVIAAKGSGLHMLGYQFVAKGRQLVHVLEHS